jgi:hypothetical protein
MIKIIKNYAALIFVVYITCLCCTKKQPETINNSSITTISLTYILKNISLAPEYTNQPLQIVQSKKVPIKNTIRVNGRTCIILPDSTNVVEMMRKMDVFKPIPVVEIRAIKKSSNGVLNVDLFFRTTGNLFLLKLKKNSFGKYEVFDLEHITV